MPIEALYGFKIQNFPILEQKSRNLCLKKLFFSLHIVKKNLQVSFCIDIYIVHIVLSFDNFIIKHFLILHQVSKVVQEINELYLKKTLELLNWHLDKIIVSSRK